LKPGATEAPEKNQKKGPVRDEALKGSLNPKVSKGPEETTGGNQNVSDGMNYVRVFPCCKVMTIMTLINTRVFPDVGVLGRVVAGARACALAQSS
jgi:hypothetical protein